MRHDALAKYGLKAIIKMNHPNSNFIDKIYPEYILKVDNLEYWWNLSIKTTTNIPNNKSVMIVWGSSNKNVELSNLVVLQMPVSLVKFRIKYTIMGC